MHNPLQFCLHARVQELGPVSRVPPEWAAEPASSIDADESESGWCRGCERYVWRALGGIEWAAFTRPA
jgi:hypothetical protein